MPALKLLITGAQGQLGRSFAWLLQQQPQWDVEVFLLGRSDFDITDAGSIARGLLRWRPDIVINTAAYTAVDKAESEPGVVAQVNVIGPGLLAHACSEAGIGLIHISTDYVFDGTSPEPYAEDAPTMPINVYGSTKREGELAVLSACPDAVVLRTSWVFSQFGSNFLKTMLRVGQTAPALRIVADQYGGPTYAPHIAQVLVQLAQRLVKAEPPSGVFHFTGQPEVTWYAFAEEIFRQARAQLPEFAAHVPHLTPITTPEYPTPARRPLHSTLAQAKLDQLLGGDAIERDWRKGVLSSLLALRSDQCFDV